MIRFGSPTSTKGNIMKKTIFCWLLCAIFLSNLTANAQSVGASQIKKKTDGGIAADSANALTLGIKRSTVAPTSPVSGMLWLDTTTNPATLKTWNGSAWEIPPTAAGNVLTDLSSLPASPWAGQIVWISSLKKAIIYDSTNSSWYYLDATNRKATATYNLDGNLSSAVLTDPATAPTLAAGTGTSSAGTHVCAVTFINSTGGETLPGPSSSAVTTTAGQGISVSGIPTGGAGVVGRRVYCSEAGTTTPLFLAGTLLDNTTTTLTVGTATNAAFIISAPDVNFSAPIPSGWTVRLPNENDISYGGCGSTGTSLLCTNYSFVTVNTAATNSVRLTYGVTDGSGNWKATYRVLRASSGFSGNQSIWEYGNVTIGYAASSNSIDAPESQGIGGWLNSSADYKGITDYPVAAVNRFVRAVSGTWGTTPGAPSAYLLPTVVLPIWVSLISDETYEARWAISTDAQEWSYYAALTPSPTAYLSHVGIACERINGINTTSGSVVEIDSFIVEPR